MRLSKWVALALSIAVSTTSLSACGMLRTPYERQKIQEMGGSVKKKNEAEAAGADSGGGSAGGEGGGKEKKESPKILKEKKEGEKKPGQAESVGQRKERQKGQGLIYILPHEAKQQIRSDLEQAKQAGMRKSEQPKVQSQAQPQAKTAQKSKEQAPQLHEQAEMSAAVSKLEGVDKATVLVDAKHHAYVALSEDQKVKAKMVKAPHEANKKLNVKTEGDIPQPVQERIAAKLRALDPKIKTVHITNHVEHVQSFQHYADELTKGKIEPSTHALDDHLQDIWK
ncbi:hypothetical protein CIG75_16045 [Tumebacillus algifaecis]|uniref:Lipoprotein n=1 Tax=Tumebacillus algifaecis TaxID=1214604 RepID=A0A223D3V8_9BACL|nr:YhcN/YlaJ family sporulation lipoprotein [Tumebacillus algifaecis]ASS76308.1 hypothetical protein CIG75_16045 [Tumebacillus algifaecis]